MTEKEAYISDLTEKLIASIERHGGKGFLSSAVLTGSFGRNEPTFTRDDSGNLALKSDVEIALIYRRMPDKEKTERLIRAVSSEFSEDLNLMPISEGRVRNACNFNYSVTAPKFKTIFTYDFFHGSRTIWGEDLLGCRSVPLSDVDPYEAKRLTANRIGELVYCQSYSDGKEKEELGRQWKGKLMLAVAGAWLLCEGSYVSSYHGQKEVLSAAREALDWQIGPGFYEEYEKVFRFLRDTGEAYEVPDRRLRGYVRSINNYFKKRNLTTPRVNSVSRLAKYRLKYMKTGMRYGVFGYEDRILQKLLDGYGGQDAVLGKTADIWHHVLY